MSCYGTDFENHILLSFGPQLKRKRKRNNSLCRQQRASQPPAWNWRSSFQTASTKPGWGPGSLWVSGATGVLYWHFTLEKVSKTWFPYPKIEHLWKFTGCITRGELEKSPRRKCEERKLSRNLLKQATFNVTACVELCCRKIDVHEVQHKLEFPKWRIWSTRLLWLLLFPHSWGFSSPYHQLSLLLLSHSLVIF